MSGMLQVPARLGRIRTLGDDPSVAPWCDGELDERAQPMMTVDQRASVHAIIVGAGIAGLVAADTLSRAGRTVTVLEARDRVGGRAHSIRTADGAVDLGATWYWSNEPLVAALAEELGVPTFAQYLDGDALFEPDPSGVRRLEGNPIDAPAFRFASGARNLAVKLAERLGPESLRLGEPVSEVALTDRMVRVESSNGSLAGNQIIIAVPPPLALGHIRFTPELPAAVRGSAESISVWMGDVVKAVAVFDQPFWRELGLSGSAISYAGPFREFHDHSGPDGTPAAIFAFAPAAVFSGIGTAAIDGYFRDQLGRLFGQEARACREIHIADWSTERFTAPQTPAASTSSAGFSAPAFRDASNGRIHWASTEISAAYAGHLEGAIHAGRHAARSVLAQDS